MPQDVADLVAAAKDGDRGAFDELVRLTYAATYTLAYRLTGDEDDARDVVQEAYLRAYRGLRRFRGDAQFSTWLYRITANCAATHLGRRARHRHDELDDTLPVADDRPDHDPQLRADADDLHGRLQAALAALPDRLRAVVVLRDVYDLPHESIAAELGISESAAKVRLHRARHKLREQIFGRRDGRDDEASRAG
jgi:RNA polymerase sigma-70 factor (ECF subfamily)